MDEGDAINQEGSELRPGKSIEGCPAIEPIKTGTHRPAWSVMIPTYNCADYLKRTIESVISQNIDPSQMQIEVVDDCSTKDCPERVTEEVGKGRVSFYRQPRNMGATATFNMCIKRSVGHIVHILHGDDVVRCGFYQTLGSALAAYPEAGAACCRYITIDDRDRWLSINSLRQQSAGLMKNCVEKLAVRNFIAFAGIAVRRSTYEQLGGFCTKFVHSADREMWVRIAAHLPVWYEPKCLACYRVHSNNDTGTLMLTGANVRDSRMAVAAFARYLPRDQAAGLTLAALHQYAQQALLTAQSLRVRGYYRAALIQAGEAVRCDRSLRTWLRALRSVSGTVWRWMWSGQGVS